MRNAQEDAPVLFRTRWALSYLRGPLTLPEIARLTAAGAPAPTQKLTPAAEPASRSQSSGSKPVLPAGIDEYYLDRAAGSIYQPYVLGLAKLHFVNAAAGIDAWETRSYLVPMGSEVKQPDWSRAEIGGDLKNQLRGAAVAGVPFGQA